MRHEIRMTVGAEFMALLDELRAELSPATAANLRLRCRAHNDLAARQASGPEQ